MSEKLDGIKAIARYLLLSESTVMDLIQRQGLPAQKNEKSATWSADPRKIDQWMSGVKKPAKKAKKPGPKKAKKPGEDKRVIESDGDRKVK